ncbi:MAG: PQQ-dependent sugar dehydrogenase [Burkholderiales bacterium]
MRSRRDGRLDPQPVAGLPEVALYGQGGLMDVALHPRFKDNGLDYLSFAARGADGYLYLLTDESRAVLARLEPAP